MTLPDAVAATMLVGLLLYALLGGADFGGGVWDLLASGPRAEAQRRLVEKAISPVWEVNHIWLIFVVVLLFTAFPRAFAVASIALHIPLVIMLVGIVLRGSAFAFRQYGHAARDEADRWGSIFAVASTITPIFLGVIIGAITAGDIRDLGGVIGGGFFGPWLKPFPFAVGGMTLSAFAFLAAVYLTCETTDPELRDDFRRRALWAGAAVVVTAAVAAASAAGPGTVHFRHRFFGSWWSAPLILLTAGAAVGAFVGLWTRRFRAARVAAAAVVALMLAGWALGQRPFLIAPDVTIAGAAAPRRTLVVVLWGAGAGSLLLVPALYWLFRVFKSRPTG